MDPLLIIALTPGIPETGLRALAETLPKGSRALNALASRPDLTEPIAETLHKRVVGKARAATVRHITDPERLRELFKKNDLRPAVCANPNTPVDILDETMKQASLILHAPALRAACNPSTPLETRKTELQKGSTAEILVSVSSPVAMSVVRAYALVSNNQWMLETGARFGKNIQRALVSRPIPAQNLYDSFRHDLLASVRIPGLRNHPLRKGIASELSVDDLLRLENVAADLELLGREPADENVATRILRRDVYDPEPQIIATCVNRFGLDPLLARDDVPAWADSRVSAAAWLEPFCAWIPSLWIGRGTGNLTERLERSKLASKHIRAKLSGVHNNTRALYENLISLAPGWEADIADLLDAAEKL